MGPDQSWIDIEKDPAHIKREKEKARKIRKTNWWRGLLEKGKCHYCGKIFPAGHLTMDHIVPLSRGGKSKKGNLVPCCRDCNGRKKYLTPAEMIINGEKLFPEE